MWAYLTKTADGSFYVKLLEKRNDIYMTGNTRLYHIAEHQMLEVKSLKNPKGSLIPFIMANCFKVA